MHVNDVLTDTDTIYQNSYVQHMIIKLFTLSRVLTIAPALTSASATATFLFCAT